MKVWIVGRITDPGVEIHEWQFRGFYGTRLEAIRACVDEDYFVSGVEMGKDVLLEQNSTDTGRYFPLLATREGSIAREEEFYSR